MKFKKITISLIGLSLFFYLTKIFLFPKIVCDDFIGGPLPFGTVRGVQCQCKGQKFFIEHNAASDDRDLSLCLGIIEKIKKIK